MSEHAESHEHQHEHDHDQGEQIHRAHPPGLRGLISSIVRPHSHDAADSVDSALESSARGLWALKVSLAGLGATALFQLVVVSISGSVALLGDTIHNFSDALTALPLGLAFILGRRAASRRYSYGYGRAEDLAGVFIVLMIALSSAFAGWESLQRLFHPREITHIGWVAAAAVIGFLGNEGVAIFRIRVGKEIGSAALVADGYHARTDGLASLAVLIGAVGALFGFRLADPIVGLGITIAILFVLKGAAVQIWHRLMDASDPAMVDRFEREAQAVVGVQAAEGIRVRWLGHRLEADLRIVVNEDLPTRESHMVAENVRHALFHAEPKLATAVIHIDPCGHAGDQAHITTDHHTSTTQARAQSAVHDHR